MNYKYLSSILGGFLVLVLAAWGLSIKPNDTTPSAPQVLSQEQQRQKENDTPKSINLRNWKLTLPDKQATEIPPADLVAGYQDEHVRQDSNGLTFWSPVTGGTTKGSNYPRSELREMIDPTDDNNNWTLNGMHQLKGTATILEAPSTQKVIIAQIHSFNGRPLLKLQWEKEKLAALVKQSTRGENKDDKYWFANQQTSAPLGTPIDFALQITNNTLAITINEQIITHDITANDPTWNNQTFYFKAGAYPQDNQGPADEGARVHFTALKASHTK